MNTKLKLVLAFGAGTLFGGLVIYRKMEDNMNAIIKQESDDLREYYASKNEFKPEEFVDEEDFEEETLKEMVNLTKNYQAEANVNYAGYAKKSLQQEMEERGLSSALKLADEMGDEHEVDMPERRNIFDAREPYVISFDSVGILENYDTQTLTYYPDVDELVDNRDEPVEDVESLVGAFQNEFGHISDSDETVYIRNEGISMDFEIVRSYDDYTDVLIRTAAEAYEDAPTHESMNAASK